MLMLALGVVVATAVGARARDLCADWTNGGSFVLKGFKIPSRNKCGPVHGFDPVSGYFMITGTACTTVAGDRMTLQYIAQTRLFAPSYLESAMCEFRLPLPEGDTSPGCRGTYIFSPGNQTYGFDQSLRVHWCYVDILY